jgi:N-acetylneuraminic acid mutarotase
MRIFLFIIISCQLYAQSWTQLSNFPGSGRDDAAIFMINQKAYCVSGKSSNNCERDMFVFDCTTESWGNAAPLPLGEERQYASAFSWNGKGYLLCGVECNNVLLKDFFQYDPVLDSWLGLPDFAGTARHGAHAVLLNNKAYLIGGYSGSFLNEVWQYDLTNAVWMQKGNLPLSGFWRGSAFVINGKIFIAFGFTNNNNYNHHVYEYDELNDSWSMVNNIFLPAKRYVSSAVINNQLFCYGGQDSLNTITNSLIIIDVNSQTTTTLNGIPSIGRKGGICFSYNNQFYVTTGLDENGVRTDENWRHDGVVWQSENEMVYETVVIYPNPSADNLTINSHATIKRFCVYDCRGKLVHSYDVEAKQFELNVTEYE